MIKDPTTLHSSSPSRGDDSDADSKVTIGGVDSIIQHLDINMEDVVLEDSYSEAFVSLFQDCDKETTYLHPSLMPSKFASLIEVFGLKMCEIPQLVQEGISVRV